MAAHGNEGEEGKMEGHGEEVLKYCPNCDYGEFIHPNAERFKCLICQIKICPKCNSEPHPGMSCKEHREK